MKLSKESKNNQQSIHLTEKPVSRFLLAIETEISSKQAKTCWLVKLWSWKCLFRLKNYFCTESNYLINKTVRADILTVCINSSIDTFMIYGISRIIGGNYPKKLGTC